MHGAVNFSPDAATAIAWTSSQLDAEDKAFLDRLPLEVEAEDRLYVHADASDPAAWTYVTGPREARASLDATRARVIVCGHTHVPLLCGLTATQKLVAHTPPRDTPMPLTEPRRWLAVLGSVGQPRDGSPAACYGMLDTARQEIAWMRVPYDVAEAARKIRAAGLPDRLAVRLAIGS